MKLIDIWKNIIEESKLNSEFKKWFGNSRIRQGGKPLVMYHGTNNIFDEFDISKKVSGWLSKGFYFTQDKIDAKHYGSTILTVYLSIKNPFVIESDTVKPDGTVDFGKDAKGQIQDKFPETKDIKWSEVSDYLESKGYDGIINSNNLVVAFNPNQIKSTTNNGEWSISNSNIYK